MAANKNTAPTRVDTLTSINSRALGNLGGYDRVPAQAPPAPPAVNQSQQTKK